MLPPNLEHEIRHLVKVGPNFKPHKYVALLAAMNIVRQSNYQSSYVYFDELFRSTFSSIFKKFSSEDDRNRPYTPFFHLKKTSFWTLVPKPGRELVLEETETVGGPAALTDIVDHAELSESFMMVLRESDTFAKLENLIEHLLAVGCSRQVAAGAECDIRPTDRAVHTARCSNSFVSYLNSLQRQSAGNENAIAEAQACSPYFSHIFVAHPLTPTIISELQKDGGRHVILTGHAGDGKSTIAVEVYKNLAGIAPGTTLQQPLDQRAEIEQAGISIIKDLSERDKADDQAFLRELSRRAHRFLIVSNTGTLLDLLLKQASFLNVDRIKLEDDVLSAISDESGEAVLRIGNAEFLVFNLARIDNLGVARSVFEKMLASERWHQCKEGECATKCPIWANVQLLQNNQLRVVDRIFLAYRRMYEYGTRLTMRQLAEHLAYLITAGLEAPDIAEIQQKNGVPHIGAYWFFNRFFGDDGQSKDFAAQQMKTISEIEKQGFGERPCPSWERLLWLQAHGLKFKLGIPSIEQEFQQLRHCGARSDALTGLSPGQAREQARRILYFLYDFSLEKESYISQYLNSPMILGWQKWQQPHAKLDSNDKFMLEHQIYHVLQEHFTGVRLPEGSTQNDRRLYVTLSRRRNEVRQSAQVVIAQVDWSTSMHLRIEVFKNATGLERTDLVLSCQDNMQEIPLKLTLPFLDYVIMRHFGEVGEVLQVAYLERLERFKAQVQAHSRKQDDGVMLVRLRTDHTFCRQQFAVSDGRLGVSDVR